MIDGLTSHSSWTAVAEGCEKVPGAATTVCRIQTQKLVNIARSEMWESVRNVSLEILLCSDILIHK